MRRCKCHDEPMYTNGTRRGVQQYRCRRRKLADVLRREHTVQGRALKAARNARRVYVHEGPGGRMTMPTHEQAVMGRAYMDEVSTKLRVAQAAERKAS